MTKPSNVYVWGLSSLLVYNDTDDITLKPRDTKTKISPEYPHYCSLASKSLIHNIPLASTAQLNSPTSCMNEQDIHLINEQNIYRFVKHILATSSLWNCLKQMQYFASHTFVTALSVLLVWGCLPGLITVGFLLTGCADTAAVDLISGKIRKW